MRCANSWYRLLRLTGPYVSKMCLVNVYFCSVDLQHSARAVLHDHSYVANWTQNHQLYVSLYILHVYIGHWDTSCSYVHLHHCRCIYIYTCVYVLAMLFLSNSACVCMHALRYIHLHQCHCIAVYISHALGMQMMNLCNKIYTHIQIDKTCKKLQQVGI